MAVHKISIETFLQLAKKHLVIDVRSPKEFQHAHIPNALSMPLFDDEERKIIGTTYKQQSRNQAIKIGLDFFGVKMKDMVDKVESLLSQMESKTVLVHCWRGGMRSAAVAWLLDLYGFKVSVLTGGYKKFRNWALEQIAKPYPLIILSGYTGSGKTEILHELEKLQQPVLDLEGIAGHKGSAFGDLGLPIQPSTEQFENQLAFRLNALCSSFGQQPIWVESESSRIGNINVNHLFFNQMKEAKRIHIEIPLGARLNKVVQEYGMFKKEDLMSAVERIQRRLGGLETKKTLEYLNNNDTKSAFEILIRYYDKFYKNGNLFTTPVLNIQLEDTDHVKNASLILKKINS